MGRNIDRGGFEKRIEVQQAKQSGSKSPKTDKVKANTSKQLNKNLGKKK